MIEMLRELSKWRKVAKMVAEAAEEVLGSVEVYVVGGVAEGRFTAASGLDVLILARNVPPTSKKLWIAAEIRERAIHKGAPLYYPLNLHIYNKQDFDSLKKYYKKMIRIK